MTGNGINERSVGFDSNHRVGVFKVVVRLFKNFEIGNLIPVGVVFVRKERCFVGKDVSVFLVRDIQTCAHALSRGNVPTGLFTLILVAGNERQGRESDYQHQKQCKQFFVLFH